MLAPPPLFPLLVCSLDSWTNKKTHILDSLCVYLKHFNPLTSSERQGFRHPSVQGLQPKQVTTDHSRKINSESCHSQNKGGWGGGSVNDMKVHDILLYLMKTWVDWTPDSDTRAWHQQQGHLVLLQSSQYRFKQVRSRDSRAVVRNTWEHFPAAESAGLSKAQFYKQKHLGAPADLLPCRKEVQCSFVFFCVRNQIFSGSVSFWASTLFLNVLL